MLLRKIRSSGWQAQRNLHHLWKPIHLYHQHKPCFYLSGLLKIETAWEGQAQKPYRPVAVYHYIQDRYIEPDFLVDVTEFVERKFDCIKAYKTQFFDPNSTEPQTPISGEEFLDVLKGKMQMLGRTIGAKYAEGFTVERQIGIKSFFDLI